ncbi:MAG TPA: hypothetical protein VNW72_13660 [Chthoniobacterales bacterium]|nr:hypothetical protein [Chthoniobacterales bacterium]
MNVQTCNFLIRVVSAVTTLFKVVPFPFGLVGGTAPATNPPFEELAAAYHLFQVDQTGNLQMRSEFSERIVAFRNSFV